MSLWTSDEWGNVGQLNISGDPKTYIDPMCVVKEDVFLYTKQLDNSHTNWILVAKVWDFVVTGSSSFVN